MDIENVRNHYTCICHKDVSSEPVDVLLTSYKFDAMSNIVDQFWYHRECFVDLARR